MLEEALSSFRISQYKIDQFAVAINDHKQVKSFGGDQRQCRCYQRDFYVNTVQERVFEITAHNYLLVRAIHLVNLPMLCLTVL
jgi:hypothetical protein